MKRFALFLALSAVAYVSACAPSEPPMSPTLSTTSAGGGSTPLPPIPPEVDAAVNAPDRDPDDRALDEGRKPAETLAFFGIHAGARVAEIAAGRGYSAELFARAVGSSGTVYAENNKFILEKFAEGPWSERLKKPAMKNVIRVDRELEDPLPPEAKELDAVVNILFYHDTVWMKTDRAKMNAAIFASLKHGGVYGIVDHSGRRGSGLSEVQTIHRIEEAVLRKEVEAAGFKLAAEGDFLRNPADARDWNASPMKAAARRGTSDRFVLKFVKP